MRKVFLIVLMFIAVHTVKAGDSLTLKNFVSPGIGVSYISGRPYMLIRIIENNVRQSGVPYNLIFNHGQLVMDLKLDFESNGMMSFAYHESLADVLLGVRGYNQSSLWENFFLGAGLGYVVRNKEYTLVLFPELCFQYKLKGLKLLLQLSYSYNYSFPRGNLNEGSVNLNYSALSLSIGKILSEN